MLKRVLLSALPLAAAFHLSAASGHFPDPATDMQPSSAPKQDTAVLAGGCFWGMEAVFESLKGVSKVVSGFAGGAANTAHYEVVSEGRSGHAESVEITYDPSQITYGQLLKVYFSVAHDPTQLNRQGPDYGPQYRSAIFYNGDEQKRIAEAYIKQLEDARVFKHKIATQVVPLHGFYAAEGYHQGYLWTHKNQPYIVYNDLPKLDALHKEFPELVSNKKR